MKNNVAALLSGLFFALGLGISGMTNPLKVIGFLDFLGAWDASLLLVMAGAVLVYALGYRLVFNVMKRKNPFWSKQFYLPTNPKLTPALWIGSAVFGVGWGLAGFCPGPGIVAISSGALAPVVFVGSMIVGILFYRIVEKRLG